MKVLYVLAHYPKISETYIPAEISFMLDSGVDVQVWSKQEGTVGMEPLVPAKVHRGSFLAALRSFQPDIVHVHYLCVGDTEILTAGAEGIPVTIRGHSFDFNEQSVLHRLKCQYVRRIYLFPHFAAKFANDRRVMPVRVAYDPKRYSLNPDKDRALVLRTCVANHTKGIEDFLRVSALCPNHRFLLIANTVDPAWMPTLREMVRNIGRAHLLEDVPNDVAARYTHLAGIYLDTNDPKGHSFGMPISVAEAMATGSAVLIRTSQPAIDYVADAGWDYLSVEEAAARILQTGFWDEAQWREIGERAARRAQEFSNLNVMPAVLEDWRGLCRSRSL